MIARRIRVCLKLASIGAAVLAPAAAGAAARPAPLSAELDRRASGA